MTVGETDQTAMPTPAGRLDVRDAGFAGFALAASFALQFRFPQLIGSDGYFHVRAAERVLAGDRAMPWMPGSVFADGWVDHQLLFHGLMAPFAWLLPGAVAAKAAAATFAAVAIFALWRLLRSQACPLPALFALLPAGLSWLFLLRLEMPRTQSLSLALLLLGLGALASERHRALAVVGFLYAWTYHVSLVLLPVSLLYAAVVWIRSPERPRSVWMGPAAAGLGLAAGFTLHPHSPRTWRFLWQHVVQKVANRDALPVGLEWGDGGLHAFVGLDGGWTIASGGLVALLLAAGLLARSAKRSDLALAVALLAGGATAAVLLGTKFVEYSVPLSVLALGLALRDHGQPSWLRAPAARVVAGAIVGVLLLLAGRSVVQRVPEAEPDPQELAAAMAFLRGHAEPDELVFHFHWNDFPELVFHGPEFRYIVGLDPHFLYLHDPERWRLFEALGAAYDGRRSSAIRGEFGARWAVLRLPHPGARQALASDPGLRPVFDDGANAVVYRVCDGACGVTNPEGPGP
jgi:hypothetical protein